MTIPTHFPTEPKHLWKSFYDITQIPRPSGKEQKFREYLQGICEEKTWEYKTDNAGNVVIYVPGTSGYENKEPVLIQNHMDMVCDNTPERKINFETDPILTFEKNGWLYADGTTLGADNGIGCAAALAAALDENTPHPPLELLFTVDEETGLHGALNLDASLLRSKKMLNLDTEDWGVLFVGCAGGYDRSFRRNFELTAPSEGKKPFEISLTGLRGGHSGVDIHMQQGNALKLLSEILVSGKDLGIEIAQFQGGRAHNIIPRDAYAKIYLAQDNLPSLEAIIEKAVTAWLDFLPEEDHEMEVGIDDGDFNLKVLTNSDQDKFLQLVSLFPHGAHKYNWQAKGRLVSLSNNLAQVHLVNGEFFLQTSVRFFDKKETLSIDQTLDSLEALFSLKVEKELGYPSWTPNFKSPLLDLVKDVYEKNFGEVPEVTAIHAGLECGILKEKLGEMDIVSFGPTIMGAHSPTERIDISTVEKFWKLYKEVLKVI